MSDHMDDHRLEGPCRVEKLIGHGNQQRHFLKALREDRLPHAWLLQGPEGVGKASFAWLAAKFILSGRSAVEDAGLFGEGEPATRLDSSLSDPFIHRISAKGHADLKIIEREVNPKTGKMRSDIVVDQIHKMHELFKNSSAEGGWRVVLIDAVDDLNVSAANAFLKLLEEPPHHSLFFLINHRPGRVLATLKSRCRQLIFRPLATGEIDQFISSHYAGLEPEKTRRYTDLSAGVPGQIDRLITLEADQIFLHLDRILRSLPALDGLAVHGFIKIYGNQKSEDHFELALEFLDQILAAAAGYKCPENFQPVVHKLAALYSVDTLFTLRETLIKMTSQQKGLRIDPGFFWMTLFETLRGHVGS